MIEGPIGDMVERSQSRKDFKAPWYAADVRPLALESGSFVVALICSEPCLDPKEILSLKEITGPSVSVVRVPGGRAAHAIQPLAVIQGAFNCGTILVIHHTDCGLTHLTDQDVRGYLMTVALEEKSVIDSTKLGGIRGPLEESFKEDIAILRAAPWIQKRARLIVLKYDTHTGVLSEVQDSKLWSRLGLGSQDCSWLLLRTNWTVNFASLDPFSKQSLKFFSLQPWNATSQINDFATHMTFSANYYSGVCD